MPRKVHQNLRNSKRLRLSNKGQKRVHNLHRVVRKGSYKMGFYESKRTLTSKHYRRSDGLHVVLTKRRKRKRREELWNDERAKITILKVHRDSEKHETIKFDHRNFFTVE